MPKTHHKKDFKNQYLGLFATKIQQIFQYTDNLLEIFKKIFTSCIISPIIYRKLSENCQSTRPRRAFVSADNKKESHKRLAALQFDFFAALLEAKGKLMLLIPKA